ncbi:histone-lysine N-methyltransferase EHMT2-like [Symsagittifera roscoffensis]|uniref:histone-lysine N-methyltransferase EHMT2-like n=1 Tax=Symsagittifera roscoffensis TaxID=84072 RepID=UPI00307C8FDC
MSFNPHMQTKKSTTDPEVETRDKEQITLHGEIYSKLIDIMELDDVEGLQKLWNDPENQIKLNKAKFEEDQKSLLHLAVEYQSMECCELILQQDQFAVNACSSNGTTAFELAVARAEPDLELIQLMLDRGCDPTAIFQLAMHDLHVYQLIHCHLLNKAKSKRYDRFTLIDDIALGLEKFKVPMKNYTSTTGIWSKFSPFIYINRTMAGAEVSDTVQMNDSPREPCECSDGCGNDCSCVRRGNITYSTPGLIHVPPSDLEFPVLFQCSSECRCTNCGNQWASSGSEYPVGVYFVSESMGFDLRSMCTIPEGAFVGVYAGRVQDVKTTCEDSDDDYIFEIPCSVDEKHQLFINSKQFGNYTRFINHSCNPNLEVIEIKQENYVNFSNLGIFARTEIQEGRQLALDYGDEFWKNKKKSLNCRCKFENCKYANNMQTAE